MGLLLRFRFLVAFAAATVILGTSAEAAPDRLVASRPTEVRSQSLSSRRDFVEIRYQIPTPRLSSTRRNGQSYGQVDLAGSVTHSPLEPGQLPVIRQFVAIPQCDGVELEVEVFDLETRRDVDLPSRPVDALAADEGSRRQGNGRGDWARIVDIQHARGQALARVEVYPVKYEPEKRILHSPREIRLRLKPVNPRGPVAVNTGPLQSALGAVVPNLDGAVGSRPSPKARVVQSSGQVCWCDSPDDDWQDAADYINSNCAADYLIIVADELLTDAADSSLVEQLAAKRAEFNGFNVAIARMGQIDSTPDNTTTPTLIRNLVEAIYDAQTAGHMEDERLGFLLLLGDALNPSGQVVLPTSYWNVNSYATEDLNASDAYFVLLDGTNDVIPDLLVGRLPVDADESNWELGNVISKITSFEPVSPSSAWTDQILLMSGGDDEKFTFEGEGLSGFEGFFDAIENLVSNSGKTFTQLHRLAATSDIDFSREVCDKL